MLQAFSMAMPSHLGAYLRLLTLIATGPIILSHGAFYVKIYTNSGCYKTLALHVN